MVGFSFVTTQIGSADRPVGPVSDLDVYQSASGPVIYATVRQEAQIIAFDLDGQALAWMDSRALPGTIMPLGGLDLDILDIEGGPYVVALSATPAGLPRFMLGESGQFTGSLGILRGSGLGPDVAALTPVEAWGQSWVLAADRGERGLQVYVMEDAGVFAARPAQVPSLQPAQVTAPRISDLTSASINGTPYVFATDDLNHRVYAYQMTGDGHLIETGSLGALEGLGLGTPGRIEHVSLGGLEYLIVASAGSSSLSVLQVSPNGALSATDHLVDDRLSRFQGVSDLDVVTAQGRTYVVAGGADDGVSLFLLRPDGRLTHLDSLADQPGQSLQNVSGLVAIERDGGLDLFVGSAVEAGVSQFRLELSAGGIEAQAGTSGGSLEGSARADVLQGGAGADDIRAGAGDDLVLDGFGADQLWGGTGADLFAFAADGKADRIRDFDVAEDLIDLSAWPLLRSLDQLSITSQPYGGQIRFNSDSVQLHSLSGQPLEASAIITRILDNFHHFSVDFLTADQVLVGTTGDDVLRGNGGDDMLFGMGGDDLLIGGLGRDTAAYTGTKGAMVVDLVLPHLNTNTAAGDVFDGIENLRGSAGSDELRGDAGANILEGGTNSDRLIGRAGDDELRGGMGFDTLIGGHGADLLRGGLLTDTADYSDSRIGLTVDLGHSANNTGIARGDRYRDVENLRGSAFDDTLGGDDAANRLMGREGADRLLGRSGADLLIGGVGDDWLEGGAGADILRGGSGADQFVFHAGSGSDTVSDFFRGHDDHLLLDATLWSGTLSARQVITRFGSVSDAGLVLDFGTDSLLIEDEITWNGIRERIDFF